MMALRPGLTVALALAAQGCMGGAVWNRRHVLPPPAVEYGARGSPPGGGGQAPALRSASRTSTPTSTPTPTSAEVASALSAVSSLVGRRTVVLDGVDYGTDCAALVRAAFAKAGRALPSDARDAAALHALALARGALTASRTPAVGDLVFLADRPGGRAAHVGLVTRSESDGTAVVLHRTRFGVLRLRVNLAYPSRPLDPVTGKHINDALRVGGRSEPAGILVVGVSDLLRRGTSSRPTKG